MTIDDFVKMCSEKKFTELKWFLTSDIKDTSLKILATAIFETYHPKGSSHSRGLSVWNNKLSGNVVPPMLNLFSGMVDLIDFVKAFQFAKHQLKDDKLAEIIREYVYSHKTKLSPILLSGQIDQPSLDAIHQMFPGLQASTTVVI